MKHPKTHINQINEDQTQRTNIKSSKGKTTNNPQGDPHKDNSWSVNRNSSTERNGKTYLSDEREKPTTHQTSSSTNAKGSSSDRKHRKGLLTRPQNNKVNGNGIIIINNYIKCWMPQPKDKDWLNGYKNETPLYAVYKRPTSNLGTDTDWKWRAGKDMSCKWRPKESRSCNTHIR